MKKVLSLLLCLLLLISTAQAEALRPRRDAVQEAVTGQAAPLEVEALPKAEALGSLHGSFSIAKGMEARNWEFAATLTRQEMDLPVGEGEDGAAPGSLGRARAGGGYARRAFLLGH